MSIPNLLNVTHLCDSRKNILKTLLGIEIFGSITLVIIQAHSIIIKTAIYRGWYWVMISFTFFSYCLWKLQDLWATIREMSMTCFRPKLIYINNLPQWWPDAYYVACIAVELHLHQRYNHSLYRFSLICQPLYHYWWDYLHWLQLPYHTIIIRVTTKMNL